MFPKGTFIFYTICGPAFLPLSYYGPGAIATASKGVNSAHQIATSKTIFSGTGGRDSKNILFQNLHWSATGCEPATPSDGLLEVGLEALLEDYKL